MKKFKLMRKSQRIRHVLTIIMSLASIVAMALVVYRVKFVSEEIATISCISMGLMIFFNYIMWESHLDMLRDNK